MINLHWIEIIWAGDISCILFSHTYIVKVTRTHPDYFLSDQNIVAKDPVADDDASEEPNCWLLLTLAYFSAPTLLLITHELQYTPQQILFHFNYKYFTSINTVWLSVFPAVAAVQYKIY